MGRFDWVDKLDFCPACGEKLESWQTKDGWGSYGDLMREHKFTAGIDSERYGDYGDIYTDCPKCGKHIFKRYESKRGWLKAEVEKELEFAVPISKTEFKTETINANFKEPNQPIQFTIYRNFGDIIEAEFPTIYKDEADKFLRLLDDKIKNKEISQILGLLKQISGYGYSEISFSNDTKLYCASSFFLTNGKFSDKDDKVMLLIKLNFFYDLDKKIKNYNAFVFEPIDEEMKIFKDKTCQKSL